jgi:hypothetical protein
MITLATARDRPVRDGQSARVDALARYLEQPYPTAQLERVARWASLALRARAAFVYFVSKNAVRIIGAHGLGVEPAKRTLPSEHGLLLPRLAQTLEGTGDLELFSATLGLPFQPYNAILQPLVYANEVIGALCVVDFATHDLDTAARQLLGEFAQLVTEPVAQADGTTETPPSEPEASSPENPASSPPAPVETLRGNLEDIGGAVALVQLLARAGNDGCLRIGHDARLHLHGGRIVHAHWGTAHGEGVVRALMTLERGAFGFTPSAAVPAEAGLSLEPSALALELAVDPDRDLVAADAMGMIVLPNIAAALKLVTSLGGAAQFAARTLTNRRWSGPRLVLYGRGMTVLVSSGSLEAWRNHAPESQ